MSLFVASQPSLDAYWRAIILFGRNSAAYKFALGQALLGCVQRQQTFVTLEDLAPAFARAVTDHLKANDRQGTSGSSRFLTVCRDFNAGKLTESELHTHTVKLGFVNVIDAFHVVNQGEVEKRFFVDERKTRGGITLTDDLLRLAELFQYRNLGSEVEARWKLVETAWALNLSPALLSVKFDPVAELLFVDDAKRRIAVTSCRDALNGYQKGKCFYCFSDISVLAGDAELSDVDHFFPRAILGGVPGLTINLDGIWNLVLACRGCNRGAAGKFARVPQVRFLERLHRRNSYLIDSHHPLRETLMNQTGATEADRRRFLQQVDRVAISALIHRWAPGDELTSAF
jgi:hypothetical protein